MKTYFKWSAAVVMAVLLFGLILPHLISGSTEQVALGVVLLVLTPPAFYLLLKGKKQ